MLNRTNFYSLLADESGVAGIEYALLGSLIAVAIAATVTTVGLNLGALYEMVRDEVVAATSDSGV